MIERKHATKAIDGTFKMPFGKYKGEKLENIPPEYLEWLCGTLEPEKYNNKALIAECQNQIKLKQGEGVSREPEKKGVTFSLKKK